MTEPGSIRKSKVSTVMKTEAEEFIPTRRSLLSRLKDWEDQQSWKSFSTLTGK